MIHYQDDTVTIHHGDCVEVLKTLPDNSVDSVVTDPPYGLEFMGKDWDAPWKAAGSVRTDDRSRPASRHNVSYGAGGQASIGFQEWCTQWAAECLRVLKPGGHILAFGGTRMWHRLAAAIEDAGFEIRDCMAWCYSSGFPKALDVSKAIDKAAGVERLDRVVDSYGGNRVLSPTKTVVSAGTPVTPDAMRWDGWTTALKPSFEPVVVARKPFPGTVAANVVEHGTGALNTDACRVDGGRWPPNMLLDDRQATEMKRQNGVAECFPAFRHCPKAPGSERPSADGVQHATVKPLELMRWLVRLVTPPDGTVLEPFAGSGTTVEACLREGKRCIAIERDGTYLQLIVNRIDQTQLGFDLGE